MNARNTDLKYDLFLVLKKLRFYVELVLISAQKLLK